jgi:hypothetical protein
MALVDTAALAFLREPRFDHLVLGVADLRAGIEQFAELTGVEPSFGGEHPELGTRNALVALDDGSYLEIVAPALGVEVSAPFAAIKGFQVLTPMAWAVAVEDLDSMPGRLRSLGLSPTEMLRLSRFRPEGSPLQFAVLGIEGAAANQPFFIEWGKETHHPSLSAPRGCTLASLILFDPKPRELGESLGRLGLAPRVEERQLPGFQVILSSPKGEVTFSDG